MSAISGPLRIHAGPKAGGTAAPPEDPYLARLVKLIPAEILALYVAFKEVASTWLGTWAMICLALVVIVRCFATKTDTFRSAQIWAVLVAAISFALWVYATGGQLDGWTLPTSMPGLISILTAVWTFLVPYLYKGD
jgi:hypothetical protein